MPIYSAQGDSRITFPGSILDKYRAAEGSQQNEVNDLILAGYTVDGDQKITDPIERLEAWHERCINYIATHGEAVFIEKAQKYSHVILPSRAKAPAQTGDLTNGPADKEG